MFEKDKKASGKAPKATVETGSAQPEEEPTAAPEPEEPSEQGRRSLSGSANATRAWLRRTFPGHENAVLWGIVGFVAAILIFVVGFWQTLFVAILVTVGVSFGQYLDGDPKIWRAVSKLFTDNRS